MSKLTWSDLLIENITPEQFSYWMTPWFGVVGGTVAPAFLTKFGFWFLRRPEGTVEMLDVYTGQLQIVADSYEAFIREVNELWWQEAYLLSELVLKLHETGKIPAPGECYALAPHPAIGGPNPINGQDIDLRFVMVMDMYVWQTICAQAVAAPAPSSDPSGS